MLKTGFAGATVAPLVVAPVLSDKHTKICATRTSLSLLWLAGQWFPLSWVLHCRLAVCVVDARVRSVVASAAIVAGLRAVALAPGRCSCGCISAAAAPLRVAGDLPVSVIAALGVCFGLPAVAVTFLCSCSGLPAVTVALSPPRSAVASAVVDLESHSHSRSSSRFAWDALALRLCSRGHWRSCCRLPRRWMGFLCVTTRRATAFPWSWLARPSLLGSPPARLVTAVLPPPPLLPSNFAAGVGSFPVPLSGDRGNA